METVTVSEKFPVKPRKLFKAWLDSKMHSQMTSAPADIDPTVGGKFTLRSGRVTGSIMELVPDAKIVLIWRQTDFPVGAPDSMVTVEIHALEKGAGMVLTHSNVPVGMGDECRVFWKEAYFRRMSDYFARG
jgi:activator of HSP90 ATPase